MLDEKILEVIHVSKTIGRRALVSDVSFEVKRRGEVCEIVGPILK
ncbi:hypothetical protein [Paenibacillus sp. SYP-B3998]|nr:hypothetical protein [Paenibacillus sp. SYP-B3998]